MKRWGQTRLLKRLSPVLLFLIGGSVVLFIAGTLFAHTLMPTVRQNVAPANTPSTFAYNIYAIQAHQQATTTVTSTSTTHKSGANATPTPKGTSAPGGTSTPSSTPTATQGTPTPPPGGNGGGGGNPGSTLPPGSALPSEGACAGRIASSSEIRPDNNTANHSVPSAGQIANLQPWNSLIGMDDKSDSLRRQITGNFTGTTDEILQWVACKWGIDVNIVRAEAVQESNWHQSQLGDFTNTQSLCPPGTWNGSSCYQSYGILQIKYTYFKTEWPMSQQDTAFNAEFVYGWIRNCYEGWADYLYNLTPSPGYASYHAGDIWGCLGFWFSGGWYTSGAINYINIIKQDYQQKPWLQSGF